jgi:UDP-N-acetylglucosamine--N-acetylmuramyl-(pentapeptide) pyrophosphoryl-undecaprenol N-acetylglucosamine transferase
MDLAYAAADAVLGRCGMTTVAEVTAVGLPAVYVPLPHGNGEQALNAAPVVAAGGGVLVDDDEMDGERAVAELVPLLTNPRRLAAMSRAARASGHADADERLARLVLDLVRGHAGEPRDPVTEVIRIDPRSWRDR